MTLEIKIKLGDKELSLEEARGIYKTLQVLFDPSFAEIEPYDLKEAFKRFSGSPEIMQGPAPDTKAYFDQYQHNQLSQKALGHDLTCKWKGLV